MTSEIFTAHGSIAIRDYRFATSMSGRIARKLRRVLTPAAAAAGGGRIDRVAVQTPNCRRDVFFRKGTSDEHVIWSIFDRRDYDLGKLARFAEILELVERRHRQGRHPLIIDAGANIGMSAVFFALTFPTALVVAIEPEPGNFELLVRNTQGLNVRCLRAALAARDGRVALVDPGEGNWGFRTQQTASDDSIPCVTMNGLYRELAAPDAFPFIAKIDIEGGEADVFASNTEWVAETPVIVAELHDWMLPKRGTALPFLRCVSALDRDFVHVGEDVFSIDNAIASR